jgi:hypothetical protein
MGYKNMWSCVADLEKNKELIKLLNEDLNEN